LGRGGEEERVCAQCSAYLVHERVVWQRDDVVAPACCNGTGGAFQKLALCPIRGAWEPAPEHAVALAQQRVDVAYEARRRRKLTAALEEM
jgi:hypothetical protein